ncbi:hypothetical protein GCM10022244_51100 [Streptomyces gulbargensis]|uniref:Uncharacterized protein n=1 Tax=Streptomyces gulbargensis TaxID=364901 RepID=A0ABP7N678_9ACTN
MVQGPDVRGDEQELEGENAHDEQGGPWGDGTFQFIDETHAPTLRGGGCSRRWDGAERVRHTLIVRAFEMS